MSDTVKAKYIRDIKDTVQVLLTRELKQIKQTIETINRKSD